MNIYNNIVANEIEEVINSFSSETYNIYTIHKINIKLCNIIKKYGVFDTFPYCMMDNQNKLSILFKNYNGDCKLKFQI